MKTDKEAAVSYYENLTNDQLDSNSYWVNIINAFEAGCKHKEESRWIPVTERLPEHNQQVIFKLKDNSIRLGRFLKNDQWESPNMFCDGSFHHLEDIKGWMLAPV